MSDSHVLAYSVTRTKLIELVEKHPCIYNSSKSSSTDQKQAWKTISEQLVLPDYLCREQWRKLRKGYIYALKNNKKFVFDKLFKFMQPHLDLETKQPEQKASTSSAKANDGVEHEEPDDVVDLEEDLWANNEEDGSSPPKKSKTNNSTKNSEFGAQYLANPVLNDTGSTTTGLIRDFMIILSSNLEDLTEEQLRKFKRRAFVLLNDIVDENKKQN